mgnify:CR=1 FL=1
MMKTKYLAAAAAIALSAGVEAVNLHNFAGEVLLVPYYTARDGQATYMSVINTSGHTKAVKVRFLEALNSREVLDFNLYMSPYDVWTGAVLPTIDGAKIFTMDESCTVPIIPEDGEEFRTFAYDGSLKEYDLDGGPTDKDRVREGHIEIIEMGVANDDALGHWDNDDSGYPDSTHVDGIPEDCQSLVDNWKSGDWTDGDTDTLPPTGGLFGNAAVIDVPGGTEVDVPVTILNDFSAKELHYHPGTLDPNLSHANPAVSAVLTADNRFIIDKWLTGIDAVSAAMMTDTITQEYTVNPVVFGESAWVISMPTKHYHVDLGLARLRPFSEPFEDGQSCDEVEGFILDREENLVGKEDVDFSPRPDPLSDELCYETNVLNWNSSDMLRSQLVAHEITSPYKNGWATLTFTGDNAKMHNRRNTYYGLPAIGFAASRVANANVGVGAAYGISNEFQYARSVKEHFCKGVDTCTPTVEVE